MKKVIELGKAIIASPKVKLAAKALVVAVVAVAADFFGLGQPIIDFISNF